MATATELRRLSRVITDDPNGVNYEEIVTVTFSSNTAAQKIKVNMTRVHGVFGQHCGGTIGSGENWEAQNAAGTKTLVNGPLAPDTDGTITINRKGTPGTANSAQFLIRGVR